MKHLLFCLSLLLSLTAFSQRPELIIPLGHTGSITAISISTDGKYVLTGSADKTVKIWESTSGRRIHSFEGPDEVKQLAFSPDNRQIIALFNNGEAKVWDSDTRKEQFVFKGGKALSSNGKYLLSILGNSEVQLIDLSHGSTLHHWQEEQKNIVWTYFSPHSQYLTLSFEDGISHIRDISSGNLLLSFKERPSYSPDGQYVLVSSDQGQAEIWNLTSKTKLCSIAYEDEYGQNAFHSPKVSEDRIQFLNHKTVIIADHSGKVLDQFEIGNNYLDRLFVCMHTPKRNYFFLAGETMSSRMATGHPLPQIYNLDSKEEIQLVGGSKFDVVQVAVFTPNDQFLLTGKGSGLIQLWETKTGTLIRSFGRDSAPIQKVDFLGNGTQLMIGSSAVALMELQQGNKVQFINPGSEIQYTDLVANGKQLLTVSSLDEAQLWDLNSGGLLKTFVGRHNHFFEGAISIGDGVLRQGGGSIISAILYDEGQILTINRSDGYAQNLIPKPKLTKYYKEGGEQIQNYSSGLYGIKKLPTNVPPPGEGSPPAAPPMQLPTPTINASNPTAYSPHNNQMLLGMPEGNIILQDNTTQKKLKSFSGHKGAVTALSFHPSNPSLFVSASADHTVKIWNLLKGIEIATIIPIQAQTNEWIVTTPDGLFDASTGAMSMMYYTLGLNIIDLEQLKGRYWEPGLLSKLFGFNKEPIRKVIPLNNFKLYPETKATIKGDQLQIQLKERNGGIGKTSLWINGKMVEEDLNPARKATIQAIDLSIYQQYFLEENANLITVRAYDKDNWLPSPPIELIYPEKYTGSKGSAVLKFSSKKKRGKVNLYGLIVGTKNYSNDALDLKFPDQDAIAMAQAIRQSAAALWGADKVTIKLLSTDPAHRDLPANKENVKKVLTEEFKSRAKAGDILVVYFSGHGKAYQSPNKKQPEFYYLTKDVTSDDLSDDAVRQNYAISSKELSDWINAVPALYQVMIIDACNSGTVVDILRSGKKAASSSQARAIDRMKDRTGMNVLVGSASNKVSFEASEYGQGLLTYSLLLGMRGAALRKDGSDQFVDIGKLFNFATEQVGILASNIGEVQQPQLLLGAGFDLGLVDETVKIPLVKKKPVFIRSNFQDEDFGDVLDLKQKIDAYIQTATAKGSQAKMIFVDVAKFENAYAIRGQYTIVENQVKVRGRLYKGKIKSEPFQVNGNKNNVTELVQKIIEKAESLIK